MSTSPSTPASPVRRVSRTTDDRIVAGVCGGIGRYFDLDPTLVRIAAAALVLLGGIGAVAYLAAWVLIPEEGQDEALLHKAGAQPGGRGRAIAGAVLLGIAILVLAGNAFPHGRADVVLPVVLGGAGALLLFLPERARGAGAAPKPAATTGAAPPPPAAGVAAKTTKTDEADTGTDTEPATADTAVIPPAPTRVAPAEAAAIAGFVTPAYGGGPERPTQVQPPVRTFRPLRKRPLTGIAVGLFLVAAAIFAGLTAADIGLDWDVALAGLVATGGVILAVTSIWAGSPALVVVAFVVAGIAALAIGTNLQLRGTIGELSDAPRTAAEIPSEYRVAAGQLKLDLRHTDFTHGTKPVKVHVSVGRAVIVLPADARVTVKAKVSVGNQEVVDRFSGGTDLSRTTTFGPLGGPYVELDATVGVGDLEIRCGNPPWPTRNGRTTSDFGAVPSVPVPTIERSHHAHA